MHLLFLCVTIRKVFATLFLCTSATPTHKHTLSSQLCILSLLILYLPSYSASFLSSCKSPLSFSFLLVHLLPFHTHSIICSEIKCTLKIVSIDRNQPRNIYLVLTPSFLPYPSWCIQTIAIDDHGCMASNVVCATVVGGCTRRIVMLSTI